jgi:hypothetical protein
MLNRDAEIGKIAKKLAADGLQTIEEATKMAKKLYIPNCYTDYVLVDFGGAGGTTSDWDVLPENLRKLN